VQRETTENEGAQPARQFLCGARSRSPRRPPVSAAAPLPSPAAITSSPPWLGAASLSSLSHFFLPLSLFLDNPCSLEPRICPLVDGDPPAARLGGLIRGTALCLRNRVCPLASCLLSRSAESWVGSSSCAGCWGSAAVVCSDSAISEASTEFFAGI
jgi:hypothetical protein